MLPTPKGHLDQERANIQSTKMKENQDSDKDFAPTDRKTVKTCGNAARMYTFTPKEKTYSDQTGCFPYCSSQGNEHIMVMYDYDSNAFFVTH